MYPPVVSALILLCHNGVKGDSIQATQLPMTSELILWLSLKHVIVVWEMFYAFASPRGIEQNEI